MLNEILHLSTYLEIMEGFRMTQKIVEGEEHHRQQKRKSYSYAIRIEFLRL